MEYLEPLDGVEGLVMRPNNFDETLSDVLYGRRH